MTQRATADSNPFTTTIAGLELRPLSAASALMLKRTNNKMLSIRVQPGVEPVLDFEDPDLFEAVLAFIYIHAAPFSEVVTKSRESKIEFEIAVAEFTSRIPLSELLGNQVGGLASPLFGERSAEKPETEPSFGVNNNTENNAQP